MAEAVILSLIRKLENYREEERCEEETSEDETDEDETNEDQTDKDETNEEMERVIKEMRKILDIVRDKKLGEGRRLNFLLSDLVHMAHDALHLYKRCETDNMGSIHRWIGEIKMRMLKLGADEAETTVLRRSENDREGDDDQFVIGLERDIDMLLRKNIIGGDRHLWPFLIQGMSGIGKTTLARQLYNHADVFEGFDLRAWVCVTNLTLKEILIKLIQQVAVAEDGENLLEEMDNRSLLDMLHHHLQGMRFLIVLDDVPRQMHLKSFLDSLPEDYNGSRLLLTSHMTHKIAKYSGTVHRMEFLDSNKSWQLFLKTINDAKKLTSEQKFPKHLEYMGKHMLKKCGGLPLAIKEVGKQLAEKKISEGNEWEQLLESVDFGPTLDLLELFYQKLHPKLESCFLSMAFYKEGTTLRAKKLTQVWVAGGLASTYDCDSCLDRLFDESVIEVKNKSTEYHMNPLLRRLSIRKAEEKLGFEILSRSNGPSQTDPHHRVIICSREKFNYSTNQDKHLVSLFFHGGGYFDASPSYWKSFEVLKILDLEDFGLKILPESIGTLKKLSYLGLRNNYIQELPESFGCLKKLEVLDIAQNFLVDVPDVIWEMGSLLHLYMSDVICQKPFKIGALKRLKTLTYVSVDSWTYELSGFKRSPFLEKLGIEELDGNTDVSKLFVSLADFKYLKHLILRGYRFRSMPCLDELGILKNRLRTLKLDGLLTRLPSTFPPKLKYLELVNSCLDEDPMPPLEKLPKLEYLKLRNAYTGQQMVILHNGFPELKVMCLEELWNLRNVQLGEDAMEELEKLEIYDCPYLDTLPEEIGSLDDLKEFKMVTTKGIATKMRNSNLISEIKVVSVNP